MKLSDAAVIIMAAVIIAVAIVFAAVYYTNSNRSVQTEHISVTPLPHQIVSTPVATIANTVDDPIVGLWAEHGRDDYPNPLYTVNFNRDGTITPYFQGNVVQNKGGYFDPYSPLLGAKWNSENGRYIVTVDGKTYDVTFSDGNIRIGSLTTSYFTKIG